MQDKHKMVIKKFIDDDIKELSIYGGYKGDIVMKLKTIHLQLTNKIHAYCSVNNIECVTKFNKQTAYYELYVIAEDRDVYALKESTFYR
jgi:hypothetical protein